PHKYIEELVCKIHDKYANINVEVVAIKNDFFGESITVSGLITGTDLINQLKGKSQADEILIPVNMLRSGESVFLDDLTIKDVKEAVNCDIRVVGTSGLAFLKAIAGIDDKISGRQIYEQADSSDSRQT
ncbi:MAG: DUF512 domain-containing protein, partial [Parasporobacterium sp.]|nr:DUF512 domain-containing protein [Parasporobacterium sp.]